MFPVLEQQACRYRGVISWKEGVWRISTGQSQGMGFLDGLPCPLPGSYHRQTHVHAPGLHLHQPHRSARGPQAWAVGHRGWMPCIRAVSRRGPLLMEADVSALGEPGAGPPSKIGSVGVGWGRVRRALGSGTNFYFFPKQQQLLYILGLGGQWRGICSSLPLSELGH